MAPSDVVKPKSVDEVMAGLAENDYLADEGLATSIFLSLTLGRPLFLEGEAGVGKTEVARVLSRWLNGRLIRLQCYEGIDSAQAVYEWDYARQLLHLRTAEATSDNLDAAQLEAELYDERFLIRRALLEAVDAPPGPPPILLIDEIDRADDEFEAFLLEALSDYSITVPELGTFTAKTAAAGRTHLQPHPRRPRRPQASMPVPLGRASRLRAGSGDRQAESARCGRLAGPAGRGGHGGDAGIRPL